MNGPFFKKDLSEAPYGQNKSILLSIFFALTFGVLLNLSIPRCALPDNGQLLVRSWERNFLYQVW
jgi:hypothetical protein